MMKIEITDIHTTREPMTEHARFGRTGLKIFPLAFGTMTLGDPVDEKSAFRLLDRALERGVNFLDSANMYNAGEAESILGRWLRLCGHRDRLIISSKVRYRVGDDAHSEGLNPKTIERELEQSLRRLDTDYLDIYFLHQPDPGTPIEVTWQCLDRLARAGRFRYVGLSNFAAWQIVEADHIAAANGWIRPTVVQTMYNLIARRADDELLPMTTSRDLGVCNYNPLAGGLLTGKYGVEGDAGTGRMAHSERYRERYWHPRQRHAAQQLAHIAEAGGRSPVELAIRFCLDQPAIDNVILGATSLSQLDQALAVADSAPLDQQQREQCESVWLELSGPIPKYNR